MAAPVNPTDALIKAIRERLERAWPEYLDSRKFYELMQAYRAAPLYMQDSVSDAYDKVRFFIRDSSAPTDLKILCDIIEESMKALDQIDNTSDCKLALEIVDEAKERIEGMVNAVQK